jgi:hypothetical protein
MFTNYMMKYGILTMKDLIRLTFIILNFNKYLPCQNERKITDLTVQNFNTGSNGIKRSFVAK